MSSQSGGGLELTGRRRIVAILAIAIVIAVCMRSGRDGDRAQPWRDGGSEESPDEPVGFPKLSLDKESYAYEADAIADQENERVQVPASSVPNTKTHRACVVSGEVIFPKLWNQGDLQVEVSYEDASFRSPLDLRNQYSMGVVIPRHPGPEEHLWVRVFRNDEKLDEALFVLLELDAPPDEDGVAVACDFDLLDSFRVRGVIVDGAGQPVGAGRIGAYHRMPGTDPELVAEVTCKADGSFLMDAAALGDFTLCAVARGRRPVTMQVLQANGLLDLGLIVLDRGTRMSGVISSGTAYRESIELEVISAEGIYSHMALGKNQVFWEGGRLENSRVRCIANEKGEFDVFGLRPGSYYLHYQDSAVGGCMLPGSARTNVLAKAPATGLVLGLSESRIRLRFANALGAPLRRVKLHITEFDMYCSTGVDEFAVLSLAPGTTANIVASCKGYSRRSFQLQAPQAGAVRDVDILLDPLDDPGQLTLVLDSGNPLESIGVEMRGPREDGADELVLRMTVRESKGQFDLGEFEPGEYQLDVRPDLWGIQFGYLLAKSSNVLISSGKRVEKELGLALGGMIEVSIKGEGGEYLPARCILRRRQDMEPVDALQFLSTYLPSNTLVLDEHIPHPEARLTTPAHTVPALPEGSYVAEIELEGYQSTLQEVDVVPGQTTILDVILYAEE